MPKAESRFEKRWWNLIQVVLVLELISREYYYLKGIDRNGYKRTSSIRKRTMVVVFIRGGLNAEYT